MFKQMAEIRHSIKAVSRKTGLSAHVIRVWERRYKAVQPSRTGTNRRLYSEADVERLGLLKQATQAGHSIGTIADLPVDRLMKIAAEAAAASASACAARSRPRTAASPRCAGSRPSASASHAKSAAAPTAFFRRSRMAGFSRPCSSRPRERCLASPSADDLLTDRHLGRGRDSPRVPRGSERVLRRRGSCLHATPPRRLGGPLAGVGCPWFHRLMRQVTSADGTPIAVFETGAGDPVVIVNGAFSTAHDAEGLAHALAERGFRAVTYDRRARGESGATAVDMRSLRR